MLFVCGRWAYAETTTINGIRWTYTITDGEASVGDWSASQTAIPTSTRGNVAIPKVLDGCPVVGIMDGAFKGCASIRSVTMPEGVTSIGKGAFNGCSNLKSISIPQGVSVIEKDVFRGCISLASIVLPDGIVEISEHSFAGCDTLKSISLPQALLKIGPASFDGCGRLAELTLPEGVIEIRAWTLARTGLRNFTFPSGISRINNNMFFCCKDLVSVTIPSGVTEIGGWVFQGCTQLKSVTIPDSVKRIGDHAFIDCTSLRSLKIPSGVTWIGGDAFKNCQSLRSLSLPVCLKGNTYNLGIPPGCKVSFSDGQDDGDNGDGAEGTLSETGQPPPSPPEENAAQLQVPMPVHAADQPKRPCTSPLVIDVSSMSKAYDTSGISMYKCKSALKDFEKAVENANLAAAAHREKIADMTKAYLNNCLAKAQEAGDLDRVVAFKKAIETADDEISGELEEITKLRSGREDRLARLNQGLVTTCLNAARTLNVSLDFQKKEMTKKGDIEEAQKIAAFQKRVLVWANEAKAKPHGQLGTDQFRQPLLPRQGGDAVGDAGKMPASPGGKSNAAFSWQRAVIGASTIGTAGQPNIRPSNGGRDKAQPFSARKTRAVLCVGAGARTARPPRSALYRVRW